MPAADPGSRFAAELARRAEILGVELAPESARRMSSHYDLLLRWNRRVNLTRVVEPEEAAVRHFAESLVFLKVDAGAWTSAVDVGSGAGFPGLALAAALPEKQITLLEPVGKKAVFLREVSRDWGNVTVRDLRVEQFDGQADWVWMRAVNPAQVLGELARVGRNVALWVGPDGVAEARKSRAWAWDPELALPGGSQRSLLIGRQRLAPQ